MREGPAVQPGFCCLPRAKGSWKPLQSPFVLVSIGRPVQAHLGFHRIFSKSVSAWSFSELAVLRAVQGNAQEQLLCGSQGKGILPLLTHFTSCLATLCAPEPSPHIVCAVREVCGEKWKPAFFCFALCHGERENQKLSSFKYSQFPFLEGGSAGPVLPRELPGAPWHPPGALPAPFSSQWHFEDVMVQWSQPSPAAQPCSVLCPGTFRQAAAPPGYPSASAKQAISSRKCFFGALWGKVRSSGVPPQAAMLCCA